MLTHKNLSSNALTLMDCWRFTSDDRLIHALPVFHAHGLYAAANRRASVWRNDDLPEPLRPRRGPRRAARRNVADGRSDALHPPSRSPEPDAGRLRTHAPLRIRLGAAPGRDARGMAREDRLSILERYGMTETTILTSNPYDGERRAGTVGFALPGVDVRICDMDSGEPVSSGEIGVLEVKGPNVFRGYWRMPEKTAQEFRPDGFFITGDLGRVDAGGYIQLVGRLKELVISGGFNVYPKEIENEIDALDGVLESAVFGAPHPDFGEGVTAIVVPRPGARITEASVLAALGERLAKFKAPKRVFIVDSLPRNAMGKVQKTKLREAYKGIYAVPTASRQIPAEPAGPMNHRWRRPP